MRRIIVVLMCVFIAGSIWLVYALFHGNFDHSIFEIREVHQSADKRVAVVVRRSDKDALNGDEYFLLLGEHAPSIEEAKREYFNKKAIFGTNQECLAVRWVDASCLKVTCKGRFINPDQIDVIKDNVGGVRIVYENIRRR